MSFGLYSCFALPLWATMAALYAILCREKLKRESLIAKCGGSFLSVASAGMAFCLAGENPFSQVIFWFFVLCTAADAMLEIHFVSGMVLFAGGHICLILWLWGLTAPTWRSLLLWAVAYGMVAWLFRREIPKLGKLTAPFVLYPAVLSVSLALALPVPFVLGTFYIPLAIGVLCFFISDLMVAKDQLVGVSPRSHKLIMLLYWAALYLISSALWR